MSESAPSSRPNFPQLEREVIEFWKKNDIFHRSIEERPENKPYVFYDGPPFATGLPHTGHLLQSSLKDAVPRYQTMRGYRVPRRWGWDCHGLPIEALVQKELELKNKTDVENYGVERFNTACAEAVVRYTGEWKKYIERVGRWVEFDGAYRTMDADYMESVWWAFAELWKKGLIYKDLRVSMYSPSNGTPLSNFEVAMENSYIDVEDPSVTVKFPVKGESNTFILAWTTTPWTLPANVALVVHPDEVYVRAKLVSGEVMIVAEKRLAELFGENGAEVISKLTGTGLAGLEYEPLFHYSDADLASVTAREGSNRWKIVAMPYVSMNDGTGIVHTAPGFGEDDFQASKTHQLPVLLTVDEVGMQKSVVPIVGGQFYLKSDEPILVDLESRGLIWKRETITHSVAIFARNKTRLMYRAQPAWFVDVQKIKAKMLETAKKITWQPDHLKEGRFGRGLETAPDWCISRSRFWGAPLPVWTNADGTDVRVFASITEMEKVAGVAIDRKAVQSMHRPHIDSITFQNEHGQEMKRIPEVFDCWFESGSMPFASVYYPEQSQEQFEFPGDFIAEGQDQTRGWFYSLHVLATALFGKPAFQNVICTGLLMASDGKKMSKSLKNYDDPFELMETYGADSLRLYLLGSPMLQAESVNFSTKDVETIQRTVFGTLWNVRAFYLMYVGEQPVELTKPRSMHVLDRWILSRLHQMIQRMTESMDRYDIAAAVRELRPWVDDLSTWWLRRSRDRLKSEKGFDRVDALRTLREVLLETAALMAPYAPFFAETVYQDLAGSKMSVHLDKWPKADERVIDVQLMSDMELVRAVAAAGHEIRISQKVPVRQALGSAIIQFADVAQATRLSERQEFAPILREELNVESVKFVAATAPIEGAWHLDLDLEITPELRKKGHRRELVRQVMQLRKEAGLNPSDRVTVTLGVADLAGRDAIETLVEGLLPELNAVGLDVVGDSTPSADAIQTMEMSFADQKILISLRRV